VVVDVPDDELCDRTVGRGEIAADRLFEKMLLKSLFLDEGIEEKLPAFLILRRTVGVARTLGHVVPPLFIKLGEPLELGIELLGLPLLVLDRGLGLLHLERGIGFQLLLHEVSQFQHRSLEDLKALLELGSEDLLLGERLGLRKACHGSATVGKTRQRRKQ
jgi:hypothetical protein